MTMFDEAKKASKKDKKPADKKNNKTIEMAGIKELANVNAAIKALEGIQSTLKGEVNDGIAAEFLGFAGTGKKPANFKGSDEGTVTSCQLRKRSSRSVLSADERALLDDHNISYDEKVLKEGHFYIDPEFASDSKLMDKVAAALEGVVPKGFIQYQDENVAHVIGEESIDQVFEKKDKKVVGRLLTVVGTIATRVSSHTFDANAIKELLGLDE